MDEFVKQKQIDELIDNIVGTFKLCKSLLKPKTVGDLLKLAMCVLALRIYAKQLSQLVGEPHSQVIIDTIYYSLFRFTSVKKVD